MISSKGNLLSGAARASAAPRRVTLDPLSFQVVRGFVALEYRDTALLTDPKIRFNPGLSSRSFPKSSLDRGMPAGRNHH